MRYKHSLHYTAWITSLIIAFLLHYHIHRASNQQLHTPNGEWINDTNSNGLFTTPPTLLPGSVKLCQTLSKSVARYFEYFCLARMLHSRLHQTAWSLSWLSWALLQFDTISHENSENWQHKQTLGASDIRQCTTGILEGPGRHAFYELTSHLKNTPESIRNM